MIETIIQILLPFFAMWIGFWLGKCKQKYTLDEEELADAKAIEKLLEETREEK